MPLRISDLKPKEEARDIQKDRLLQAEVLQKAADKLQNCIDMWGIGNHSDRLISALDYNAGLWNMLYKDIESNTELPKGLQINLLKLGYFIRKRILEIYDSSNPQPQQLNILIQINRNLAEGLKGSTSD